jgi:hypothetical protein
MKMLIAAVSDAIVAVSILSACATTKGAVYGAGIGALAGEAQRGAEIGDTLGTVYGIID